MRKPRDIQNYRTPAQAAAWLRGLADNVEKNDKGALVKVTTDIRWYYPDLSKAPAHGEGTR